MALKVLLPGVTFSEDAIERFSREARMTGGMHHRHIVPIYAVGEADGDGLTSRCATPCPCA